MQTRIVMEGVVFAHKMCIPDSNKNKILLLYTKHFLYQYLCMSGTRPILAELVVINNHCVTFLDKELL